VKKVFDGITLFTLPDCPRCEEIKMLMEEAGIMCSIRMMNDPEALADLRFNGCFEVEAPVIQVFDEYLTYDEFMELFEHSRKGEPDGTG
jgi:glutaredoxin 3